MSPVMKAVKGPRLKAPEQDARKRGRNFEEVSFGYTPEQAIKEARRCLECKKPTCVGGCPVEIHIPEFIAFMKQGKFAEAIAEIKQTNALPAVCGRVCPQEDQCEQTCVLGKKGEPISIGKLERFAADVQLLTEGPEKAARRVRRPKPTGKKAAIIGSGPAGLTVSGDLARRGHEVTVFEALHQAGGVLLYGIPEFRLPESVVSSEIDYLARIGVEIQTSMVIGRVLTIDDLMARGYDAVFIGTGAGLPMFMNIPGENLNGVYSANEFLTRNNLMKAYLFPEYDTPVRHGKRVAVVGGGNVAMDSARTALRLGARKVYLVYRRSEKEMPARIEEVEHAHEEGIDFRWLTNPVEILGENGSVAGMRCVRMELGEPDASGRCRPEVIPDSEFEIDVDMVVMAIGTSVNPIIPTTTPGLDLNQRGYIAADRETGATSRRGVWAGGDIVTGSATVISAMGAARRAARAIDEYLA